eukprot:7501476-Ditylum_brightwellii.AAC.1
MPMQKFLMKFALCPKHTDPNAVDNGHHQVLLARVMHGKFFIQQEEMPGFDLAQSHMWLHQAGLRRKTEASLCAAQDQAMAINYIFHEIYKQAVKPLCCLCGKHNKAISHIASSCDMLHDTKMKAELWCPTGANTNPTRLLPSVLVRDVFRCTT